MTIKLNRRSRIGLGVAALAVIAAGLPIASNPASALPPLTPPAGAAILSPATVKTSGTTYQLNVPAGATCPGDGAAGYRLYSYITPATADPGVLTYSGITGTPTNGVAFSSGLKNPTGTGFFASTAISLVTGLIILPAGGQSLSFATTAVPAGNYNIGIACTLNTGGVINTERFWNTTMTVAASPGSGPQNFIWGAPAAPAAPVLTTSSYNAGTTTATVNFTHAASLPGTTGYTATLVGTPAIAPIAVPAGASSFQIPGVALGSSYSVTLVATNAIGPSPSSNSVTVAGTATAAAPVVTANSVFELDPITVSWTQPAGVAPTDYNVVITQGATVIATQNNVAGLTATFATQPVGSYTVTVTPNYPAGSGVTGTPGVDTFDVTPGALIKQGLTVTRPTGALILTQRCGVYNGLPAFTAVANFPGFPFTLGAATATANQTGTAPINDATGAGDLEFPNYPLPNDNLASGTDVPFGNVTTCGLDMGVARFVTESNISVGGSGAQFLTGNFFAADGRLNEVTVLDTRDVDAGWTLRGDIEDRFVQPSGDSFSGDYLGWQPVMTDDSNVIGGEGAVRGSELPTQINQSPLYDQTVSGGPTVLPGDGFPAGSGFAPGPIGMTDNPVLASAAGGAGLGISTHDARLLLLIPVTRDSGNYAATLTLTVG